MTNHEGYKIADLSKHKCEHGCRQGWKVYDSLKNIKEIEKAMSMPPKSTWKHITSHDTHYEYYVKARVGPIELWIYAYYEKDKLQFRVAVNEKEIGIWDRLSFAQMYAKDAALDLIKSWDIEIQDLAEDGIIEIPS